MPSKGYQPPMVYGKPNPNYTGPEQASDMSEMDKEELMSQGFNMADFQDEEEFEEFKDTVAEQIDDAMDDAFTGAYPDDYVSFENENDGMEYSASEFAYEYSQEIEDDDSGVRSPMANMDNYTANIDINTGDDIADEANADTINELYLHDPNLSEEENKAKGNMPEDVTLEDGKLSVPASYIFTPKKMGLTDSQSSLLQEVMDTGRAVREDEPAINMMDYERVENEKWESEYGSNEYQINDYIEEYAYQESGEKAEELGYERDSDEHYALANAYSEAIQDKTVNKGSFRDEVVYRAKNRHNHGGYASTERMIETDDYNMDVIDAGSEVDIDEIAAEQGLSD